MFLTFFFLFWAAKALPVFRVRFTNIRQDLHCYSLTDYQFFIYFTMHAYFSSMFFTVM